MALDESLVREVAAGAGSREELWAALARAGNVRRIAEIGVWRGKLAAALLGECPEIAEYHMVDPWRHLDGWNKPANASDDDFERHYREAMDRTAPWADKRRVLRGTTAEVAHRLPDAGLDLAYIDGDHTLRGITVDLSLLYPKVREGGWLGGDDFTPSIWQHAPAFEPSLVFPYAVHFAEAVGAAIYGLPHDQFLIDKRPGGQHRFVDLTGRYGDLELRPQVAPAGGRRVRRRPAWRPRGPWSPWSRPAPRGRRRPSGPGGGGGPR